MPEEGSRTINKKSFNEVLAELGKHFEFLTKDSTDTYDSIPVELLKKHLNEVLGLNWSFEPVGELKVVELMGDANVIGCGKIILHDDDGRFVCSRYQSGGARVILIDVKVDKKAILGPDGQPLKKPKNLSNDYKRATADILKRCAQDLNVGLYLVIRKNENKYKEDTLDGGADTSGNMGRYAQEESQQDDYSSRFQQNHQSGAREPGESSTATITTQFIVMALGKIKGKALRIPVKDAQGKQGELILWESLFSKVDKGLPEKLKNVKAGDKIKASVSVAGFGQNLQFKVESGSIKTLTLVA